MRVSESQMGFGHKLVKDFGQAFKIETNALVQETICSPLQGQEVKFAKEHYAHLFDLDLADESPGPKAEIDILIGADVMWKILTGEVRRGEKPNESVALGTHLRYVLSGPISDMPWSKLSSVNLNATHMLRCVSVPAKPLESLEIITKQLHDGIIEEINPRNDSPEPGKVHYLPHHPVICEHAKTTKVHIVYDASAMVRNDAPSLNQCLKTGPSLIPTIFDILLQFRWNRVAVTADI